MVGVLVGAAAGMRASVWVNFVPMEACLILGPQKGGLEAQAWCYFVRACGPGDRSAGWERGRPTLAAGGNRPDIRRAICGGGGGSCGTSQLACHGLWINHEMSSELWGFLPNLAEVQLTGKMVYS